MLKIRGRQEVLWGLVKKVMVFGDFRVILRDFLKILGGERNTARLRTTENKKGEFEDEPDKPADDDDENNNGAGEEGEAGRRG